MDRLALRRSRDHQGHAGRGTWGRPVLSMYQTDIIVYGTDLLAFIAGEKTDNADYADAISRSADFWRDLIG